MIRRIYHIINCLKNGDVDKILFNTYESNKSIEEFIYRLILIKVGYLKPRENNPFRELSKKEILELLMYGSVTNKRFLSAFVRYFKKCRYETIGDSFIYNICIVYKEIYVERVKKVYEGIGPKNNRNITLV